MEEKTRINNLEINAVPQNTSIQKEPIMEGELTGYPSIDKPWLKYYPNELISLRKNYNSIMDRIKESWQNLEETIINYYDTEIKVRDFLNRIEEIAKSLVSLGIKKGDSIITSLESVPEFVELLLACEMVGCSIKNYLGDIPTIINLINDDTTVNYYIAHDYLDESHANEIYKQTNIKNIITIDPLYSFDKNKKLRKNIEEVINSKYNCKISKNQKNISWDNFLNKGKNISHIEKNSQRNIKLFSAFTSGSTGEPKEVIHSSESVLGVVNQMSMIPNLQENRDLWLHTILPPIIVSVVIAAMCYPLSDGKQLILDPYCKLEDLDLEMMHYKPNGWALIPMFFNVLLDSQRIPQNYDMSHFKLFGFGAEPLTKKYISKVQKFLDEHNCKTPLSAGYGQSEGGSGFTVAYGTEMILSGSSGIPYVDTIISIFEPNSTKELKYYEVGEICKSGPGIMLGYSDKNLTHEVLKIHPDGKLWLHTGDTGYMTKEGMLFVLGRKGIKVYPDNIVFPLEIENKISAIDGVKDAIIVSGADEQNNNFEVPYLFIVPEKGVLIEQLLFEINKIINNELSTEQKPKDIFLIDKKPMKNFKVDRKILQKKYNLI